MTSSLYIGCYASNQIPSHATFFPHCMIVNLDPACFGGSHWIAKNEWDKKFFLINNRNRTYYSQKFGAKWLYGWILTDSLPTKYLEWRIE